MHGADLFGEDPFEGTVLGDGLRIDCDTCAVRGPGCGDCVVAVLLGMPPVLQHADAPPELEGELADGRSLPNDLDADEGRALAVLAAAGMVPHLRLVPAAPGVRRAG